MGKRQIWHEQTVNLSFNAMKEKNVSDTFPDYFQVQFPWKNLLIWAQDSQTYVFHFVSKEKNNVFRAKWDYLKTCICAHLDGKETHTKSRDEKKNRNFSCDALFVKVSVVQF